MRCRHKKHDDHEDLHGGAWKIAYADFITTMMAFFLLLWVLNAASDEQKKGISDYFQGVVSIFEDPIFSKRSHNVIQKYVDKTPNGPEDVSVEFSSENKLSHAHDMQSGGGSAAESTGTNTTSASGKAASQLIKNNETAQFQKIASALQEALQKNSGTKNMSDQLLLDNRDEGLRIQIVDRHNKQLFPGGSSEMRKETKEIFEKVAKILSDLPHKISISGHTDAKPFGQNKLYSNWELSFDRANASRRILEASGISAHRIVSVIGKEAKEPLLKEDPENAQNRRITIILHRDNGKIE